MKLYNICYWLKYIWYCKVLKDEKSYWNWANKEINKNRKVDEEAIKAIKK